MLLDAGIEYTRDSNGFYWPVDTARYDELVEVGKSALDVEPSRRSIVIQSECGQDKLSAHLTERQVYFVEQVLHGDQVITVSKSDGDRVSIAGLYASFEIDCL